MEDRLTRTMEAGTMIDPPPPPPPQAPVHAQARSQAPVTPPQPAQAPAHAGNNGSQGARGMVSMEWSGTLINTRDAIEDFEDAVLAAARTLQYLNEAQFAVRLAMEEAITNAFEHGSGGRREATVRASFQAARDRIVITVTDSGPGFDPALVADPTEDGRVELPRGRGLMLIRAFMSEVSHADHGRTIRMVYRNPAAL